MTERKRFFTRHPIELKVRVRTPKGWTELRTIDVSRRGVFIKTDDPLAEHRIAQLRLMMPSGRELDAMGHVRRVVQGEGGISGMGIEFFVMSKEAEGEWDRFVLDQSRRASGVVAPSERELVARRQSERSASNLSRELVMELPVVRETVEPLPASRRPSNIVNEPTQLATGSVMARDAADARSFAMLIEREDDMLARGEESRLLADVRADTVSPAHVEQRANDVRVLVGAGSERKESVRIDKVGATSGAAAVVSSSATAVPAARDTVADAGSSVISDSFFVGQGSSGPPPIPDDEDDLLPPVARSGGSSAASDAFGVDDDAFEDAVSIPPPIPDAGAGAVASPFAYTSPGGGAVSVSAARGAGAPPAAGAGRATQPSGSAMASPREPSSPARAPAPARREPVEQPATPTRRAPSADSAKASAAPPPRPVSAPSAVKGPTSKGAAAGQARAGAAVAPPRPLSASSPAESDGQALFITVRPGDVEHLRTFIERRIRLAGVFLRSSADCAPGQPVDVAVVHPLTDAEVIVSGTVARVIRGETAADNGFLLRFAEIDDDLKRDVTTFVETGHPEVRAPTALPQDLLDQLREAAHDDPEAPEPWMALGWALLTEAEDADGAIDAFQRALLVAPERAEVHRALALAYALVGDGAKAFAFVRSGQQLAAEGDD